MTDHRAVSDALNKAMTEAVGRVLEIHTPWARVIFERHALWMACYCGWNADRNEEGGWNEHFLRALAEARP